MNNSNSPSGAVTFQDGANILGTSPLKSGSATFTTSSLPVGVRSITATYSGDSNFSASTSGISQVDVTLNSTISVEVSDNTGNSAMQTLSVTIK